MSANVSLEYTARLSTSAAAIAVGQVVCIDPTTGYYVPATDAARAASGGIVSGVAMTEATTGLPGFAILLGGTEIPASISGLAAGSASPVICNGAGIIARKAVPVPGTDCIIGDAYADGTVVLSVGVSQKAHVASVPTGTGFPHIVAGVEDAAAKLVENADVASGAAIALSKIVNPTGTGLVKTSAGVIAAAGATLVNADVSATAAIAVTKLALGGAGQVIKSDGAVNSWGTPPVQGAAGTDTEIQFNDGGAFASAPGIVFPSGNEAQFPTSSPPKWNNGGTYTTVTAAGTTSDKTLTLPNVTGYLGALTQKDSALAGAQDNLDAEVMAGCTQSLYFTAGATQPTGFVAPIAAVGVQPARLEIYHPNGITGSNEDAASTAANRMINWPEVAGVEIVMTTATLVYNTTLLRWVCIQAQVLV